MMLQAVPPSVVDNLARARREASTLDGVLGLGEEHVWAQSPGIIVGSLVVTVRANADAGVIRNRVGRLYGRLINDLTVQVEREPATLGQQHQQYQQQPTTSQTPYQPAAQAFKPAAVGQWEGHQHQHYQQQQQPASANTAFIAAPSLAPSGSASGNGIVMALPSTAIGVAGGRPPPVPQAPVHPSAPYSSAPYSSGTTGVGGASASGLGGRALAMGVGAVPSLDMSGASTSASSFASSPSPLYGPASTGGGGGPLSARSNAFNQAAAAVAAGVVSNSGPPSARSLNGGAGGSFVTGGGLAGASLLSLSTSTSGGSITLGTAEGERGGGSAFTPRGGVGGGGDAELRRPLSRAGSGSGGELSSTEGGHRSSHSHDDHGHDDHGHGHGHGHSREQPAVAMEHPSVTGGSGGGEGSEHSHHGHSHDGNHHGHSHG